MNILEMLRLLPNYHCRVKIKYLYFDDVWRKDESKIMKIGDIPYKKLNNWMVGKIIEYIIPSYDSIEGSYLLIALRDIGDDE